MTPILERDIGYKNITSPLSRGKIPAFEKNSVSTDTKNGLKQLADAHSINEMHFYITASLPCVNGHQEMRYGCRSATCIRSA